jgi:DNA polymerase III subunit chi
MTQIGFYHLTRLPLEQALPKLLEKALAGGMRAVVMAGSPERVEHLNTHLWTYAPDSWLPHGSAKDGDAERQPVWLTDHDENPNQATLLVLCDGASSETVADFARCLDLFDGNDPDAVQAARERWKRWKAEGHELVYYQQNLNGGWEEKSRT